MVTITLPITYNCNWHCSYCIVDTHNNNIINKQVLKNIEIIPDGSFVHIEGGEPGMVDRDTLINYLKILTEKKCILTLNTNGLFLQKYSDLLYFFKDVVYHCVEELQDRKDIKIYNINIPITYMLLVDNDSIDDLEYYINKYNSTFFVSKKFGSNSLTYKNALMILQKYNLHEDSMSHLIGKGIKE